MRRRIKRSSGLTDWALLTSAFFNVLQLDKQSKTKNELESTRVNLNYIKDKLKEWQTAYYRIKQENSSLRKMLEELGTELSQYKNKVHLIELEHAKLKEENARLKGLKEKSDK
jgi:septal ring factor EnvC (AmiA/AmiB activator)